MAPDESIEVIDLTKRLWRRRGLVGGAALAAASLALVVSLLLPRWYTAEASILPLAQADSAAALMAGLSSQLGAAAMLTGVSGGRPTDLREVLTSRTLIERVIDRCDLPTVFPKIKLRTELVKKVRSMTEISPQSLKRKAIELKVTAPSPSLAEKMANAYLSELKTMLDEIGYNSASRNRRFIETQLAKVKRDLLANEERLAKFQAEHKIASLPETVQAAIRSISELETRRLTAGIELKGASAALESYRDKIQNLQADPGALTQVEIRRNALQAQKLALEQAREEYLSRLSSLPPLAMKLAQLTRDVQVGNATYLALIQQYQAAIIEENRESAAFITLDVARVPEIPSWPRTKLNTVFGLIFGLLVGGAAALLLDRRQGTSG